MSEKLGRWLSRQERLLNKHEDPSSDSQHPYEKKPGMAAHAYDPRTGAEVTLDGSWELAGLAGSV